MNATRLERSLRTIRSFHEDNARVVQDMGGDDCNYTANETARYIGPMKFILWCDYLFKRSSSLFRLVLFGVSRIVKAGSAALDELL